MKLFSGSGDAIILEGELNEWLAKNPYITIKDIRQSTASNGDKVYTLMSLWYDN